MTKYIFLVISILLAVAGQLLMKNGMNHFEGISVNQFATSIIGILFNPWVLSGLFSFGISAIFWLYVLSKLDLSLAYPMVSTAYVLTALASWFLFKENITIIRWVGIITICFGVFLISRS